ncbi:hypothetical protein ACIA47_06860 [Micromonospora sp. NPDC051227]|uniref:hypothetical protein n=1 Tax=Micromonospora sp. NPDC051227 TaxID=3364285 RepID=UPI0037AEBBB7
MRRSGGEARPPWEVIGLAITLVPITIAAFKLTRVSELDPAVLLLLAQSVGLIPLVLASTLEALPLIVAYLLLAFFIINDSALPAAKFRQQHLSARILGPLGIVILLIQSPLTVGFFAIMCAIQVFFMRRVRKRAKTYRELRAEQRSDTEHQLQMNAYALIILVFFSSGMWLPQQVVTHGNETTTAYILKEDDRFTTIMRENDRTIMALKTDDITDRQPCGTTRSFWVRPFFSYFNGPHAHVPECPEDAVPIPKTTPNPSPQPSVAPTSAP